MAEQRSGRKPPGASWETWTERLIREGMDRGDFADLPGAGKPLGSLYEPHDDDWWVKEKMRREELSYLPPTLAIRKEVEMARSAITAATSEDVVRRIIGEINPRIRDINRRGAPGPPSSVMPLDEEAVVAQWRERHG